MPEQSAAAAAKAPRCHICGAEMQPGAAKAVTTIKGRSQSTVEVCEPCAITVRADLEAQIPSGATLVPAAVGGLAGGLVGAAIWAAIAAATNYEVGFVAVLVGFLTGYGVKLAAGPKRGTLLQVLAALLSVVAMAAAKYGIIAYFFVKGAAEAGASVSYFDPRIATFIGGHLDKVLSLLDALFVFLAVGAAYRVPAAPHVIIGD